MISVDFKLLFSIKFMHDFFDKEEEMLRDLIITPDAETVNLLNNYRMQWRIDKNQLMCFVQTKTSSNLIDNRPFIDFNENDILKFKLNITNGQFLNYTNLQFFETENKIYRFANDSNNHHGVRYFLSKPIQAFNSANTYQMGMMARVGTEMRQAIQYSDFDLGIAFSNLNYWTTDTDFLGYVNHSDLVEKLYKEDEKEEKCFAEIEIALSKTLPGDYSLLNTADNTIRGMNYLIHFKNRSTYWIYQFKQAGTIEDKSNQITFIPPGTQSVFTTEKPVALTANGIKTIKLNNDINDKGKILPCPNAILLKPDINPITIKSKIISEIKINN